MPGEWKVSGVCGLWGGGVSTTAAGKTMILSQETGSARSVQEGGQKAMTQEGKGTDFTKRYIFKSTRGLEGIDIRL